MFPKGRRACGKNIKKITTNPSLITSLNNNSLEIIGNGTSGMQVVRGNSGSTYAGATISVLDSPNTTSATTYQVYLYVSTGTSSTIYFNGLDSNAQASITAFEIKG